MWKLSLFHLTAVLLQGMVRRAGTAGNSCARCAARAAGPQPLHPPRELKDKHPPPAHGTSTVPLCWASLTYFSHPLLCIGRVQQLPSPKRSCCWTETTDHWSQDARDCQSPLPYPNVITLQGHTPRLGPHHSAISAFLLLVKSLRFPHPLVAIRLVIPSSQESTTKREVLPSILQISK